MTQFANQQTLEELIDISAKLDALIEKCEVREIQGEIIGDIDTANRTLRVAKNSLTQIIEGNNPYA